MGGVFFATFPPNMAEPVSLGVYAWLSATIIYLLREIKKVRQDAQIREDSQNKILMDLMQESAKRGQERESELVNMVERLDNTIRGLSDEICKISMISDLLDKIKDHG